MEPMLKAAFLRPTALERSGEPGVLTSESMNFSVPAVSSCFRKTAFFVNSEDLQFCSRYSQCDPIPRKPAFQ